MGRGWGGDELVEGLDRIGGGEDGGGGGLMAVRMTVRVSIGPIGVAVGVAVGMVPIGGLGLVGHFPSNGGCVCCCYVLVPSKGYTTGVRKRKSK
jgi:hypothetical protein